MASGSDKIDLDIKYFLTTSPGPIPKATIKAIDHAVSLEGAVEARIRKVAPRHGPTEQDLHRTLHGLLKAAQHGQGLAKTQLLELASVKKDRLPILVKRLRKMLGTEGQYVLERKGTGKATSYLLKVDHRRTSGSA